jgi:cell division protein FtsW (lipid II flippase)
MHTAPRGVSYGWLMVVLTMRIIAIGIGLMFSLGVSVEPSNRRCTGNEEKSLRRVCVWVALALVRFSLACSRTAMGRVW